MKNLITSILLIATTTLTAQHKTPTDWELAGLKGKVKTQRNIPYEVIPQGKSFVKGNIDRDLDTVAKIANLDNLQKDFNSKGYLHQMRFFFNNGDLYSRMEYFYNPQGQLFETRYNSDKTLYAYNPQGYLIKDATYSPGGFLKTHYNYQVDANGKVTKEETFHANQLESSAVYTYDKQGNAVETRYYDADGNLFQRVESKYNKQNLVVSSRVFDKEGKLVSTATKKYNAQGDCIKLQAETKLPKKQKNVATYTYVYDPQGNWTSKTTFINGEARQIVERTFTYYE
ncbi:hypothetical protein RCZ04_01610 [Capnocytophaga sp. HP1101]